MKKTLKTALKGLAVVLTCAYATSASAITYNEVGDAGQTIATAQAVANGTTEIQGSLQNHGDVDLFSFSLGTSTTLTINGLGDYDNTFIDANLVLFDGLGHGIEGDDDGGSGLDSRISLTLDAGNYLIAFGNNNIDARDSLGNHFIGNDSGYVGLTSETLFSWSSWGYETGDYRITFSTAVSVVPLPAALPLFGAGILAMGFAGWRKQRQAKS